MQEKDTGLRTQAINTRGEAGEGRDFSTEREKRTGIESSQLDFQCDANIYAKLTFELDQMI